MIGPDMSQVSASLLGIVSAIQILFRTLTMPSETDVDLLAKMAGRPVVMRIEISRSMIRLFIGYLIHTVFSLIEEPIVNKKPSWEYTYDALLVVTFILITLYLLLVMKRIHNAFVHRFVSF